MDTLGRKLTATGRLVDHRSAKGQPRNATGLFCWNWDGAEGWGENQGGIAEIYLQAAASAGA